jgi:acetyl esterase/lipase
MRHRVMVLVMLAAIASPAIARAQPAPQTATTAGPARGPVVVRKTDMIYGRVQGSALLADLAYVQTPARKPAVVMIFGGRWRANSRLDNNEGWERLSRWARDGFVTMTIDHRLVEATPAPAPYQDVLCAIRWLHAHAAEYGVDEDQIYVIGNSSGGHLAALTAILGDNKAYSRTGGWETARSDVRAGIAVAAPYELNTLSWGNLWTPLSGDVQAARRQASPLAQLSANSKPLLVVHSDDDQSVPIQQALDMVRALEAAKIPHKFVRYKDRGHVGLTDEVLQEAKAFIGQFGAPPTRFDAIAEALSRSQASKR